MKRTATFTAASLLLSLLVNLSALGQISRVEHKEVYCSPADPNIDSLFNFACFWESRKNFDEAANLYRIIIMVDSSFCDAYDNLGRIYRMRGEYDSAITLYEMSLQLLPTNGVALQNLGVVHTLTGNFLAADTLYQKLVDLYPEDAEGYYGRGKVRLALGDAAGAIPLFERAADIYGKAQSTWLADVYLFLGMAHLNHRDFVACKHYFELAAPDLDTIPFFQFGRARVYLMQDTPDKDSAMIFINRAEELGGSIPDDIQMMLSELE